jgi:predicted Na+-dependent transporter
MLGGAQLQVVKVVKVVKAVIQMIIVPCLVGCVSNPTTAARMS